MDSIANPFSPNAGSRPPELVGRDEILEQARVLIGRTQQRRSAQSLLMTGLRGVGKTVLLNEMYRMCEAHGEVMPVYMEASEGMRLGELLAAPLKMALLKLNRLEGTREAVRRGLSVLRNFMGNIRIKFGDVGVELEPMTGVGDSGNIECDIGELLVSVADAAADRGKAVMLLVDEVQYLSKEELAALVMALHRIQQLQLPLALVGAGLPILAKLVGAAKSYAERLFRYPVIGALSEDNSRRAICVPFADAGIGMEEDAARMICSETRGYPFFIQEWGSQLWNFIERGPITEKDVGGVREAVMHSLDANFFRIRMERITLSERKFLCAMASVVDGEGRCRVSDVADAMSIPQNGIGPRRIALIRKGTIYSPAHGVVAFTVPLFSDFIKRSEVAGH